MFKLIALAAAVMPALLAAPLLAQESTPTGSAAITKTAAVAQLPNSAFGELDAATIVTVVRFSAMANADGRTEAIFGEGEDPDLVALRIKVGANAIAVAALDAEGLTAQAVVAMKATHDGAVVLYVNDLT